jgi:hypothetical protein
VTTAIPAPLADGAATARRPAGACHLCGRAVLAGQRYARLVPAGQLAHVACIAARRTARDISPGTEPEGQSTGRKYP